MKKHPYAALEKLKAWSALERAIQDLSDNKDIKELTARPYLVGYLAKRLNDAGLLKTTRTLRRKKGTRTPL